MLTRSKIILALTLTTPLSAYATGNELGKQLSDFFLGGETYLDMRARYEHVDQETIQNDAEAITLRTRLGVKTADWEGFMAHVEFDHVAAFGDKYNNGYNGQTNYPTVTDPSGSELNQAYLKYGGLETVTLRVGRQALNWDNQRFIGSVNWRQHNQTMDAVGLTIQPMDGLTFNYAWIDEVHRIFTSKNTSAPGTFDSDSHIAQLTYDVDEMGTFNAYFYQLAFLNASANSTMTLGASWQNKLDLGNDMSFKYRAEIATQSEHRNNTGNYDAKYYHLNGKIGYHTHKLYAGYELLGNDNGASFRTPLATLHKFNGYADKFLTTPDNGLEDVYFGYSYDFKDSSMLPGLGGLTVWATYHDFNSDAGNTHYGKELDLVAKYPINDVMSVLVKYVDFKAKSSSYEDTTKYVFDFMIKI